MIVTNDVQQGSEEWLNLRKGRATASAASRILTTTGRLSKSRHDYMIELAMECVCDDPHEWTGNKHTDWGNAMEPEARDAFRESSGLRVREVGFCTREDGVIGFSPDGLVYEGDSPVAGLEIKCPSRNNHAKYVRAGELPSIYKMQIHWSLAASGLSRWYFMSYFPGLNPLVLTIEADDFTEIVRQTQDAFIIEYAAEREAVLNAILPSRKDREESII